jgi:hypothetical protein
MCGDDFVVLDIDPRNGGTETLAALEATYGPLPPTWTVCTGGGGEHRYFAIEGSQACHYGLKEKGVELKGVGSYVVCPSSNHVSGRDYEWCPELEPEDIPLAPLPEWVLEATKAEVSLERSIQLGESREGPSELYSLEEVTCALSHISPKCSEKEWKDVACALISGGIDFDLWNKWSYSAADAGYPGEEEARKIWDVQVKRMRKAPSDRKITLGTLIYRARDAGWVPTPTLCPILFKEPENEPEIESIDDDVFIERSEEEPSSLRETAQGIIGELACWMYDTSVREYDSFAVAGALAILSTCAQGSYKSWDGRSLSLYQICLLPAAGGKDHYLSSVEDTLHDVDSRLVMSIPGSSHGLRGDMYSFNSRVLCMDEVQDFFSRMGGTENVFVSQVMSDIKELYNGKARWKGSSLKTQVMPDIIHPRMTWVGFGTPGKFKQTINSNMVGGGLLSRILLWDVEQVPKRSRITRRSEFSKESIGALRRLANKGVQPDFKAKGILGVTEALTAYHSGKQCIHAPQTRATESLTITREASKAFAIYDEEMETRYRSSPDCPEGAIYDRASTQVAKIASLHAVGCRRVEVHVEDLEWAVAVANATIEPMAHMARTWMADSVGERNRQRVLSVLSSKPRSRSLLLKSLRMGAKDFDQTAQDLLETYQAQASLPQRQGKFPPETTFAVAKPQKKC